ncbi:MAG TPA: hypothetical protein V6D12_13530 [Candidatus Obscuribacterales bacterium]
MIFVTYVYNNLAIATYRGAIAKKSPVKRQDPIQPYIAVENYG